MRTHDALDYAFICAVSVLGYLHLPWRPEIRRSLRSGIAAITDIELIAEFANVALALVGGVLLVTFVEILPGRNGPR